MVKHTVVLKQEFENQLMENGSFIVGRDDLVEYFMKYFNDMGYLQHGLICQRSWDLSLETFPTLLVQPRNHNHQVTGTSNSRLYGSKKTRVNSSDIVIYDHELATQLNKRLQTKNLYQYFISLLPSSVY